jgi:hypothetical protein
MKREETFETGMDLTLQTSFGIIHSEDGVKMEVTVGIHESGKTGWFEMYDLESGGEDWYAEGGLRFEGKTLTDYDGVFELPSQVTDKLKEWGYETEEVC